MTNPIKAYTAHDGDEQWVIVFARHSVAARRYAANEMDCSFVDVDHCRRAPGLDEYAGSEIPAQAIVALGWWMECAGCGQKIEEEPTDKDGEPIDLEPVGTWRRAFCTPKCRDEHEARLERDRRLQCEAVADLSVKLMARFPGVIIENSYAYITRAGTLDYVSVSFSFPGSKHGLAEVKFEPKRPDELQWRVCNGDREATRRRREGRTALSM